MCTPAVPDRCASYGSVDGPRRLTRVGGRDTAGMKRLMAAATLELRWPRRLAVRHRSSAEQSTHDSHIDG